MPKISIDGVTLFFDAEEQQAANLIRRACERSIRLIRAQWGLEPPQDCRLYVMTSWLGFVLQSAPWHWKLLLVVTMPLWARRAQNTWALAGGWEQNYGQRQAVGVKPPRLLQLGDRRPGERIFVKEANIGEKVQSITCHELTHACTAHLRLPPWLQEGLAMVMVDRFFEKPTVQHETLALVERSSSQHSPGGHLKLHVGDESALLYLYSRGYWLTRYLEETRPGLLKDILSRRSQPAELERRIAATYGKRREAFWEEIDSILVSYFGQSGEAISPV